MRAHSLPSICACAHAAIQTTHTHTHMCKSGKLKREQVRRRPGRLVPFSHNQLEGNMTNSKTGVIKFTTLEDTKTWQQITWLKVVIILYIMNVWWYILFYTANYSHNYVPTDIQRILKLCCWWPCHSAVVSKKKGSYQSRWPLEFCDCQNVRFVKFCEVGHVILC